MSINPFDGKAVQKSESTEEEVPSRKCLQRRRLDTGCQKLKTCFCLSQGLPRNNVQNQPKLVEAGSKETY